MDINVEPQVSHQSIKAELLNFKANGQIGGSIKKFIDVLLQIRPTSIDSERAFSVCGMICTQRRLRLRPDKINILLFLNQNL